MKTRIERLKDWAETLSEEKLREIVVQLTFYAILAEEVGFYDTSKVPYWANSGDNLDGSFDEE